VQYEEFVEKVAERAGIERAEAERTSVAVLQALCDRLSGDEAHDLLSELPARLKTAVVVSPSALPLSVEDFLDVVADDLEIPAEEARQRVRAVFATLREAITLGEFRDVLEQLDPEYADLLA
jgi:uncharacterized protein (DUF2267 family)